MKTVTNFNLQVSRWFDMTDNGNLRMKRVSKENELKFPRKYRLIYQEAMNKHSNGASKLCIELIKETDYSVTDAWTRMKEMFNFPGFTEHTPFD